MSITPPTTEEFLELYPEFLNDSVLANLLLPRSSELLDPGVWSKSYSDGVMLDCAHNLTLKKQAQSANGAMAMAAGPISSSSAAGTNISFSTASPDGKSKSTLWYMKTSYGQEFLRLRDLVTGLGMVAS